MPRWMPNLHAVMQGYLTADQRIAESDLSHYSQLSLRVCVVVQQLCAGVQVPTGRPEAQVAALCGQV